MKNEVYKTRARRHLRLWGYFASIVFGSIVAVFLVLAAAWRSPYLAALRAGRLPEHKLLLAPVLFGCAVIGLVLSIVLGRQIIAPILQLGDAFGEISAGNFSVRLPTKHFVPEIRAITQEFNRMALELSQVETLRSDFVADVSHEFKTPIAAIEGYATLLQDSRLTGEKRAAYINKILANSRNLSNLSSSILLLSKLENQGIVVNKTVFRLDEQLRQSVLMLEDRWAGKALEFEIDLPRIEFYGSESLLEHVWINLLDNAVKHSPPGGCIEISARAGASAVIVTIADHGDGMSEETQRHIFEKFYQGDGSRKTEGNGLGLAMVKRIVEILHGQVTVRSAPGQGASFSVTLPAEEAP